MEFVIVFAFADKNGELETYEDGTEVVHTRTIEAPTKEKALEIFYEEEHFMKKPDYLVVLGGEDEDIGIDE
jgi:hypothetical protein